MTKLRKTLSVQITLSKSLRLLCIALTLRLRITEKGFGKVGIYLDPQILHDDLFLREQLFFQGICNGIHIGIGSLPVKYSDDTDIDVDVLDLEFSVPLTELFIEEIKDIKSSLEDLSTRLIQEMLIHINSSDTPNVSIR